MTGLLDLIGSYSLLVLLVVLLACISSQNSIRYIILNALRSVNLQTLQPRKKLQFAFKHCLKISKNWNAEALGKYSFHGLIHTAYCAILSDLRPVSIEYVGVLEVAGARCQDGGT